MANAPQPPRPAKRILGLFGKKPEAPAAWQPAAQLYPRLSAALVGLPEQPAIYALWHLGVRPQWLRVGAVANLADAAAQMAKTASILEHADAGVFIAWASAPSEAYAGIARYLAERLRPSLQDVSAAWDIPTDPKIPPITYPLPPGTKDP